MINCSTGQISDGAAKDCPTIKGQLGSHKDLILVNYDEFDRAGTLDSANTEADDTNGNEGGITDIKLLTGATLYTFEGTEWSVKASVTGETKEDGDMWNIHSINFIIYNKTSKARNTLIELQKSKVVAVAIDKSTGFYELFGAEQGLKLSELTRTYVEGQTGNFYTTTIATPDIAVLRENNVGLLSHQAPVIAA